MNEQLKIIISAEVSKFKQGVEEAKAKITNFKDEVKKASENVDANIKKMGDGIATGFKAFGAAILAAGAALVALGATTVEYRQNQAQLNSAFEQAGMTATAAQGAYRELYAAIGDDDQAVESAANIAMLAQNEQEAARWAETASGILGTFHDTLQPEAFYEAANETLKLGEATGAFTQMLEQTGIMSVEEFNAQLAACETEAEKSALMLSVTEQATGAAGAAYDAATADIQAQREAQASLNETLANLGAAVQPVITAFTNFASNALAACQPYIQDFVDNSLPKLQEILGAVGEKVSEVAGFMKEHPGLLTAIATAIGVIVTAIGLYNAVAAVKAAMDAAQVTTLGALITAQLASAAATTVALAPYLLIVAAIAAVIAIIVLCIQHWDTIKETVVNVWNTIVNAVSTAVDAVVNFFTGLWESITAKVDEIKTAMTEKWESIKETVSSKCEELSSTVKEKWESIKSTVSEKCEAIKANATEKWNATKENITNAINLAKEILTNIFENIKANIQQKLEATKALVTSIFEGIKASIQNKIETAKAIISNVLAAIKAVFSGDLGAAKEAVLNIFESIKTGIQNKINNAKSVVSNAIEAIKGFFNFSWSLPSLKLPHISITGSFSLTPPSVPKFSISWYELGGVFDMPTLFGYGNGMLGGLGENGAEAVVPLENNTYWLDRLATMLAEKQGVGTPIVLQVDGKTFAETSIRSMNAYNRQSGNVGLILV